MSDKRLTVELVTPEKVAWSAPADLVVLPAFEGEMGVMPGHQSFLVQLAAGEVRVIDRGEVKHFAVSGGFAEIKDDEVALFAETAEAAELIDAERAHQALERARRSALQKSPGALDAAEIEAAMLRAKTRLRVSRRGGGAPPRTGG